MLTFLRLALVPVFLWAGLVREDMMLTMLIGLVSYISDLADGKIARRYGLVTKLGTRLDPLSDRLSLAAAVVIILVQDLAPAWMVLTVVGRDALLLLVGVPLLRLTGRPIPDVTVLGKRASFLISSGVGLIFVAAAVGSAADPSRPWWIAGVALLGLGLPLYLVAAADYLRVGLRPRDAGQRQ